ncbi:MAG TPA: aminodeoxychorismate synthase component I [Cycloclasticus sp.]|jgi:anthranilate synthase component 1|nr:aminodeoxychorismate synthase component I [Cycloclasticus sp.]HIL91800.1 aminodeoxychorismate synthase component I [Cycloclasticus sp.]
MGLARQHCGTFLKAKLPFDVDLLACHALNPKRYPFLLESHQLSEPATGFDILFAYPGDVIQASKGGDTDFFTQFDSAFNQALVEDELTHDSRFPFTGGWFVFLSYELAGAIEPKLSSLAVDASLPVASAVRIPVAIIKNHKDNTCWVVCEIHAEERLEEVWSDIQKLAPTAVTSPRASLTEDTPTLFLEGVKKVKSYLKEGDTLQVNLSRQWVGELLDKANYLDVYRSLRAHNPAPFAGLARYGDSVICSSSPERLVSCNAGAVQMRPIAGTRPRKKNPNDDKKSAAALLVNAKENAEHIMLIDLIRNDLGRVCQTGTVVVDEKMTLESYAAVHHIVSNVRGKLLTNTTPSDVIKAVFPGGTITGCPKVRCMEIIQELEKTPRGAYTGSMGYINRNGDLDLNILIRTFTITGKKISLQTGAGIVADSIADNELEETRHKAKALLDALTIV